MPSRLALAFMSMFPVNAIGFGFVYARAAAKRATQPFPPFKCNTEAEARAEFAERRRRDIQDQALEGMCHGLFWPLFLPLNVVVWAAQKTA